MAETGKCVFITESATGKRVKAEREMRKRGSACKWVQKLRREE